MRNTRACGQKVVHTRHNKAPLFGYRPFAACLRSALAAGQRTFDIFWRLARRRITESNVSFAPRDASLPPPTPFLPRRRAYQAAIIHSRDLINRLSPCRASRASAATELLFLYQIPPRDSPRRCCVILHHRRVKLQGKYASLASDRPPRRCVGSSSRKSFAKTPRPTLALVSRPFVAIGFPSLYPPAPSSSTALPSFPLIRIRALNSSRWRITIPTSLGSSCWNVLRVAVAFSERISRSINNRSSH